MRRLIAVALLVLCLSALLVAETAVDPVVSPSAAYDSKIPTLQSSLGYKMGEAFTPYSLLERFYQAVAQASDRIRLEPYGKSVEGRTLYHVIISSPKNLARLEAIRAASVKLSDPRQLSDAEAQKLIAETPVIVWLMYTVHGNEAASVEAAMQVTYELAASQDQRVLEWLEKSVVVIDPVVNPDGHERYVQFYRERVGAHPRADRFATEHQERWPGGRANHYLFDLNRDWCWQTQPETAARVAAYHRWYPQVVVDFHEMGTASTYFFPPPAKPILEYVSPLLGKWYQIFGKANAAAFDQFGFRYFTRDTFDFFYPSYGDAWPSLNGAVGMTYEQGGGGAGGLVIDLPDDQRTLTLHDRAAHHFVSSLATIDTSVKHREARLRDYFEFRKASMRAGDAGTRQYYLVPSRNQERLAHVVEVLLQQGVEVKRADAAFDAQDLTGYWGEKLAKKQLPAGTYIVDLAQPAGFLARTMLDKEIRHDTVFFYDVAAWSLPLAADVEAYASAKTASVAMKPVTSIAAVEGGITAAQHVAAYIIPADEDASIRLLGHLLQDNLHAYVSMKPFRLDGRDFAAGSIVVPLESNPPDMPQRLNALAQADHIKVFAGSTLLSEGDGLDLGSDRVRFLRKPRVAVLTDTPIASTEYGALWYLFEKRLDMPFTPIATENLRSVDLNNYNVLIMPTDRGEGRGLERYIDKGTVGRLQQWVRDGGVLIAMRGAAVFASKPRSGLTSVTFRYLRPEDEEARQQQERIAAATAKPEERAAMPPAPPPPSKEEQEKEKQAQLQRKLTRYADREQRRYEQEIPGSILRAVLDNTHPLGFGMREQVPVLDENAPIFELTAKGENVAYFPKDNLKLSGYTTADQEKKLAQTAYLLREQQGRGAIILFADDPAFRGFWDGTTRLLLNAIYFGNVYDPHVR